MLNPTAGSGPPGLTRTTNVGSAPFAAQPSAVEQEVEKTPPEPSALLAAHRLS